MSTITTSIITKVNKAQYTSYSTALHMWHTKLNHNIHYFCCSSGCIQLAKVIMFAHEDLCFEATGMQCDAILYN